MTHAARSEICNRQSSGTQQRCAISSAIALADCTWLLDIGDWRMRIGDVQKPASDFCAKPIRSDPSQHYSALQPVDKLSASHGFKVLSPCVLAQERNRSGPCPTRHRT